MKFMPFRTPVIPSIKLLLVLAAWSATVVYGAPIVLMQQPCEPAGAMDTSALNAVLARQARAWTEHDFSVAAPDWAADGELTSPGGHVKVSEMQPVITDYAKHFRDLHVKISNVFLSADGKQAAIEWDWDVTRVRDGKRGVTHDAILVTFEGNKIKSWREYFDLGHSVDANP